MSQSPSGDRIPIGVLGPTAARSTAARTASSNVENVPTRTARPLPTVQSSYLGPCIAAGRLSERALVLSTPAAELSQTSARPSPVGRVQNQPTVSYCPCMDESGDRVIVDESVRAAVVRVFGDQSSLLQTIADEVGRLRQAASSSAETAALAHRSARHASHSAAEGAAHIASLDHLMQRLDRVDGAFARLNEVIERIATRVNVIEEIAFESNMLAINANIEAARAGEDGRGFTVVATSMRDLSRQSRRAANEIADILDEGRVDIGAIGDAWNQLRMENEVVARDTAARFESVKEATESAAEAVSRIASSALQQETSATVVAESALSAAENQAQVASEIISALTGQKIRELAPLEAHRRLAAGGIRLIDVRGRDEWNGDLGHISGATQWTLGDELDQELARAPRDDVWVFTCRMGGRSMRACRQAISVGLGQVYNLTGGMQAWVQAGLPVIGRTH